MNDRHVPTVEMKIALPAGLAGELERTAAAAGLTAAEITRTALAYYLEARRRPDGEAESAVYLSAPVTAMLKGFYEEKTLLGDLRRHGDFGLGTFNNLDGEMVMLDGIIYQLRADGQACPVADDARTPFACVTFYRPTVSEAFEEELDYAAFQALLGRLLPSDNMLYAIRVDGFFREVQAWSVSRQENYRPLNEEEHNRPALSFENISGVLAGFYTPKFIRSLNFPGFHLHFLTADRRYGGHLHACRTERVKIGIQFIQQLKLDLPMTIDYLTARLPR
ncbi:MAG: acetolactate decarboxylase [Pseudomonadota bacterium]|nr:acetolactate decarboxylase [Pseudomonadota bacterium]